MYVEITITCHKPFLSVYFGLIAGSSSHSSEDLHYLPRNDSVQRPLGFPHHQVKYEFYNRAAYACELYPLL